jgi:hypothetical protein
MFIKLNFTEDKDMWDIFRILKEIINTNTITSAAALQSTMTSGSWNAELTSGFDVNNSEIIRSVSPTTTKAHFCRVSHNSATYAKFNFTLEMAVHDAPNTKVYLQYYNDQTSANNLYFAVADGITGGTIDSSSQPVQDSIFIATSPANRGVILTLSGTPYNTNNLISTAATSFDIVRTFWAYITDECFVWCATLGTTYNNGWGTTYNNTNTFMGPYINSFYTRFDYWNLDSNGIIPFWYTNPRGNSVGYGVTTDFNQTNNAMYNSNQVTLASRVFNIVEAHPAVTTSFPLVYHPHVNIKLAGRSDYVYGHQIVNIGTVSTITAATMGRALAISTSERWPTTDLTGTGFMNQPIGWENTYRGCHGGNVSEQAGVFIFNGDYQPGDIFALGGKVYMIWPMYGVGYASRIGLSVPKE